MSWWKQSEPEYPRGRNKQDTKHYSESEPGLPGAYLLKTFGLQMYVHGVVLHIATHSLSIFPVLAVRSKGQRDLNISTGPTIFSSNS